MIFIMSGSFCCFFSSFFPFILIRRRLETITSFKDLGSVKLMMVPSLRYSPGQQRQQKHWQGWNQFWMTGVFLSVPRYDWCAPLSHPSSCMLLNHGPSQQSSKEEYKPWKWRATARYYASHTKTMLPTRKSVPRSSRKSDHKKTTWPLYRDANCSGMIMSPGHQVWPKPSCKAQWNREEDKTDRGRDGKTSGNGQTWSSLSHRGQWRAGKNGENLFRNHMWCPNDPRS